MKYLLVIAFQSVTSASTHSTFKLSRSEQCEDGSKCPGGCCPIADWYCCMDGGYCAEYAVDCRFIAKKQTLTKMSANKQCHDGIECPGGCCPYDDWSCCPDGLYCAASAADCPFYA